MILPHRISVTVDCVCTDGAAFARIDGEGISVQGRDQREAVTRAAITLAVREDWKEYGVGETDCRTVTKNRTSHTITFSPKPKKLTC